MPNWISDTLNLKWWKCQEMIKNEKHTKWRQTSFWNLKLVQDSQIAPPLWSIWEHEWGGMLRQHARTRDFKDGWLWRLKIDMIDNPVCFLGDGETSLILTPVCELWSLTAVDGLCEWFQLYENSVWLYFNTEVGTSVFQQVTLEHCLLWTAVELPSFACHFQCLWKLK